MKVLGLLLSFLLLNFSVAEAATSITTPIPEGQYHRPCYRDYDQFLTTDLTVQGNQWRWQEFGHDDTDCTMPHSTVETNYSVKASSASPNAVDMTVIETSYTPLTGDATMALNLMVYCGFSDWTLNVKRVINGRQCGSSQIPAKGAVIYSIAKIVPQNAKEALFLGVYSVYADGTSPSSRYTDFDQLPFFK